MLDKIKEYINHKKLVSKLKRAKLPTANVYELFSETEIEIKDCLTHYPHTDFFLIEENLWDARGDISGTAIQLTGKDIGKSFTFEKKCNEKGEFTLSISKDKGFYSNVSDNLINRRTKWFESPTITNVAEINDVCSNINCNTLRHTHYLVEKKKAEDFTSNIFDNLNK